MDIKLGEIVILTDCNNTLVGKYDIKKCKVSLKNGEKYVHIICKSKNIIKRILKDETGLTITTYDKKTKSLIGRSNRRLHWEEIIFYKRKKFDIYDFGGLSLSDSKTLSQIDKFKLGFGGKIIAEYNEKIGVSMIGKIILLMYKALKN